MSDDIKRIHWQKGKVSTSGDDGPRDIKIWLLVEEKDYQDEVTLTKAMAPVMDWFVAPTTPDGKGGHGGPMIDTHTNAVIGHWKSWGIGREPDTQELGMWLSGVVHRGPKEHNYEFPHADMVWNEAKGGNVIGGSWGGNKREGYIEFNTKTGEVAANTITKVLPYEVSLVRASVRGPNGMPATPAVPHSSIIELAGGVKSTFPGMYGDKSQQLDAVAPDQWMAQCQSNTEKFLGHEGSKEFCTLLYQQSGEKLREKLGKSWSNKERIFMDEADKKYMEERFAALGETLKAQSQLQVPDAVTKSLTLLDEAVKSLSSQVGEVQKALSATGEKGCGKKQEGEGMDKPDEEDEQERVKKELETAKKALAEATAKAEAASKESADAKKALSELASQHQSLPPSGSPGAGTKLDVAKLIRATPQERAKMIGE